MEPLVEELLELWTGIAAYDVTKPVGFYAFMFCSVLLWTIHDFSIYGTVGGFAHQGYAGCLWCELELEAEYYMKLNKQTYGRTRRWLSESHKYQFAAMNEHFNGEVESCAKPKTIFVEEQL